MRPPEIIARLRTTQRHEQLLVRSNLLFALCNAALPFLLRFAANPNWYAAYVAVPAVLYFGWGAYRARQRLTLVSARLAQLA